MQTKPFYTSKEVWLVLVGIVLLGANQIGGWDPQGLTGDAVGLYETVLLPIVLVLRLFFTKSKLSLT